MGRNSGGAEAADAATFAWAIAAALERALGNTNSAAKIAAAWTGASERTVKNWLSGRYAPSGVHVIALVRNSDDVLETFLLLAGRQELLAGQKLANARQNIQEALRILDAIEDHD